MAKNVEKKPKGSKKHLGWLGILAIFFLVAGVVMMVYPFAADVIEDWGNQEILKNVENLITPAPSQKGETKEPQKTPIVIEVEEETEDYPVDLWYDPSAGETPPPKTQEPKQTIKIPGKVKISAIGMIDIPRIDCKYTVFEGSGKTELKYGVGHLKSSAQIGEIGNCVLPGHRMYTYGKIFNRLGELEVGDTVELTDLNGEKYIYQVDKISIVKPGDKSVLKSEGEGRYISLYTCHPVMVASHRLVVRGVLVSGPGYEMPITSRPKPAKTAIKK